MTVLLDNDVAMKACRYGIVTDVLELLGQQGRPGMLGSARFVMLRRLSRAGGAVDIQAALAGLKELLAAVDAVEPDEAEVSLAAGMEEEAQRSGLPLDGGESQLLAMLLHRTAAAMVTGDKRAVAAAEQVLIALGRIEDAASKVACLEQVFGSLVAALGVEVVRNKVCADQAADKAGTVCFACHSAAVDRDGVLCALTSYVQDIRLKAPTLLAAGISLDALLTLGRRHKAS